VCVCVAEAGVRARRRRVLLCVSCRSCGVGVRGTRHARTRAAVRSRLLAALLGACVRAGVRH
jgi:hypothetical protein